MKRRFQKLKEGYLSSKVRFAQVPDFGPSEVVRYGVIFSGRVQNVGFRHELSLMARRLGLTGWVRNRADLKVEAEIQGPKKEISFLIQHMQALKRVSVTQLEKQEIQIVEGETNFEVRFS